MEFNGKKQISAAVSRDMPASHSRWASWGLGTAAIVTSLTVTFSAIVFTSFTTITSAEAASAVSLNSYDKTQNLISDSFSRQINRGWGRATSGERFAATGRDTARAKVRGGHGIQSLRPGEYARQTVQGVVVSDALMRTTFSLSSVPRSGNGVTTSSVLRSRNKSSYQARVRIGRKGKVSIWISRYDGSTENERVLAGTRAAGFKVRAGDKLHVEFIAAGSSKVSLAARVWRAGTPTPVWQLKAADGSRRRIAVAGKTAVHSYLSSSTSRTSVKVDRLDVWRVRPAVAKPGSTPTTDPSPSPSPSDSPDTTPTTTAPTTPPDSGASDDIGSEPVGSTTYPVPEGAVFVAPHGDGAGQGTIDSPYGSLAVAVRRAPSGTTIVLRGGTYHEFVEIPFNKKLVIQSYPKEAVWFDGSSPVAGWRKSGTTWSVSNWTYNFDHRVSYTQGVDETSRWVDPDHPMAGHPDMVWIGGEQLAQVSSEQKVGPGSFYVDEPGQRLVIGSDPANKQVEAATLPRALQVHGAGSTIRGIGVRRYATTVSQFGAVTAEVPSVTLENMVITDNATTGLFAWATGHTFRNLTVTDNGLMGFGANRANSLSVENSVFQHNNTENFKSAPASGGVKICNSEGVTFKNNLVADNTTAGLWLDVSNYDVDVVSNTITNNGDVGILYELSEKAVIADNYIAENGGTGIWIVDSGDVDVWNNTLSGNDRTFSVWQDERRQSDASKASKIPWVTHGIRARNNVFVYGGNFCPLLTQDLRKKWSGKDFGLSLEGNVYYRTGTKSPANFACWANGAEGFVNYKDLKSFSSSTANDRRSKLFEGAPILDKGLQLTSAAGVKLDDIAEPLPAAVADLIGQEAGDEELGAYGSKF